MSDMGLRRVVETCTAILMMYNGSLVHRRSSRPRCIALGF
jgi:hypothetical protein